jgi:PIN domain nuclease of toxin-antitoxin system
VNVLLDASALLAFVQAEPGAEIVERALEGSLISAVNFSESATRIAARGIDPRPVLDDILEFGIDVLDFDFRCSMALIDVQAHERRLGVRLSLGDRCCLATAMIEELPILTADREWSRFADLVDIAVVR